MKQFDQSVEVSYPGSEVFSGTRREDLEWASIVLASFVGDSVAPPLEFNLRELKTEEDDDASNRDAA